jgi:hypothetical protein
MKIDSISNDYGNSAQAPQPFDGTASENVNAQLAEPRKSKSMSRATKQNHYQRLL